MPNADSESMFDFQVRMLGALCPPFLSFAIGGSYSARRDDPHSDLDFFLLVPDDQLFAVIKSFPAMISHRLSPVVMRDRGFWPEFGYEFSYVYPDLRTIDYFINSPGTLRRTPMARKMRIIKDADGQFTEYQRSVTAYCSAGEAERDYLAAARTELVLELLTIRKHLRRQDLIPVTHRLERVRRVYLGLARHHGTGEPYVPHDADRQVAAVLGPRVYDSVAGTFPQLTAAQIMDSLCRLLDLVSAELSPATEADVGGAQLQRLIDDLMTAVRRMPRE